MSITMSKELDCDSSGFSNCDDSPKYALFTQAETDFNILQPNSQISSPELNLTQLASQNLLASSNLFPNLSSQIDSTHEQYQNANTTKRKGIADILEAKNKRRRKNKQNSYEINKQKSILDNDDLEWHSILFLVFFNYKVLYSKPLLEDLLNQYKTSSKARAFIRTTPISLWGVLYSEELNDKVILYNQAYYPNQPISILHQAAPNIKTSNLFSWWEFLTSPLAITLLSLVEKAAKKLSKNSEIDELSSEIINTVSTISEKIVDKLSEYFAENHKSKDQTNKNAEIAWEIGKTSLVLKEIQLLNLLLLHYKDSFIVVSSNRKYSKLLRYVIGLLGAPYRAIVSGSLLLLTQILCKVMEPNFNSNGNSKEISMDPNCSNYPLTRLMCAKLFDASHFPRTIKLISDLLLTCNAPSLGDDISNPINNSPNSKHHALDSSLKLSASNSGLFPNNASKIPVKNRKTQLLITESLQVLSDLGSVFKQFTKRKQTALHLANNPISLETSRHLCLVIINSLIKAANENSYEKIKISFSENEDPIGDLSCNILSEVVDMILGTIDDHQYTRSLPLHLQQSVALTVQSSEPKMIHLQSSISESNGGWWLENSENRREASRFIELVLNGKLGGKDANNASVDCTDDISAIKETIQSREALIENPSALAKEIILVIGGQIGSFLEMSFPERSVEPSLYYKHYIQDVLWSAVPLFEFLKFLVSKCGHLAEAFVWWVDGQSNSQGANMGRVGIISDINEIAKMRSADLDLERKLIWPNDDQTEWESENSNTVSDMINPNSELTNPTKKLPIRHESINFGFGRIERRSDKYDEKFKGTFGSDLEISFDSDTPKAEFKPGNRYSDKEYIGEILVPATCRSNYMRSNEVLHGLAGIKVRAELLIILANVMVISKVKKFGHTGHTLGVSDFGDVSMRNAFINASENIRGLDDFNKRVGANSEKKISENGNDIKKSIRYLRYLLDDMDTFPFVPGYLFGQTSNNFIVSPSEILAELEAKISGSILGEDVGEESDNFADRNCGSRRAIKSWETVVSVSKSNHEEYIESVCHVYCHLSREIMNLEENGANLASKISEYEKEIVAANEEKMGHLSEISSLRGNVDSLKGEISDLGCKLGEMEVVHQEKTKLISEQMEKIKELEAELEKKTSELAEIGDTNARLVRESERAALENEATNQRAMQTIQELEGQRLESDRVIGKLEADLMGTRLANDKVWALNNVLEGEKAKLGHKLGRIFELVKVVHEEGVRIIGGGDDTPSYAEGGAVSKLEGDGDTNLSGGFALTSQETNSSSYNSGTGRSSVTGVGLRGISIGSPDFEYSYEHRLGERIDEDVVSDSIPFTKTPEPFNLMAKSVDFGETTRVSSKFLGTSETLLDTCARAEVTPISRDMGAATATATVLVTDTIKTTSRADAAIRSRPAGEQGQNDKESKSLEKQTNTEESSFLGLERGGRGSGVGVNFHENGTFKKGNCVDSGSDIGSSLFY
ncbi:hypothetical protein AYI70_g6444 [Smittium culicis]|uniref:Uncharacterized protein n=1 Tax=Smittium culicis TaxID=133412 RepID=A0A1R1XQ08_9FUNG|nr:hypothetical protein AYI70_g6444 [Smittium culicis]